MSKVVFVPPLNRTGKFGKSFDRNVFFVNVIACFFFYMYTDRSIDTAVDFEDVSRVVSSFLSILETVRAYLYLFNPIMPHLIVCTVFKTSPHTPYITCVLHLFKFTLTPKSTATFTNINPFYSISTVVNHHNLMFTSLCLQIDRWMNVS